MTNSFIVCNVTRCKDVNHWFIISIIKSLCACSWSTTSFLKDASIYSLNVVLLVSNIFRKIAWENDETIIESSFVIDAMDNVSLESVICLGNGFFFLLSITGNDASFSMSYEALMWRVYAFCGGLRNCIVEGVNLFCRAAAYVTRD